MSRIIRLRWMRSRNNTGNSARVNAGNVLRNIPAIFTVDTDRLSIDATSGELFHVDGVPAC